MTIRILAVLISLLMFGCYTDREFIRDMKQIEAQMAHRQTYRAIEASGPIDLKLDKGSKVALNVPSQPHTPIGFMSPMQSQTELVKTLGVLGLSAYGINRLSSHCDTNVNVGGGNTASGGAQ